MLQAKSSSPSPPSSHSFVTMVRMHIHTNAHVHLHKYTQLNTLTNRMICFCVKQPLCRRPRHLFGKYDGSQSTWCISGHMNTTHHSINIQQNNIRKRNSLWSLPNSITDRLIEKFLHLHLTANQLPVLLSFASKCEYKNHWNSVCSTDLRLIIYIFHTTWFSNGESYVKFASQMIDVWGRNVHYSKSMKILIQFRLMACRWK